MILNVKSVNNEDEDKTVEEKLENSVNNQTSKNTEEINSEYNDTNYSAFNATAEDKQLYTDEEENKPNRLLIIGGIVLLLIIILLLFFACGRTGKKSDDNTLANLKISDGEMLPDFSKNVLKYDAIVTKNAVTITCSPTNKKAQTSGCNKRVSIKDDCVEHKIIVTAQNSSKKEYIINICKQSEDAPIIKEVKIEPETYTKTSVVVTVTAESKSTLNSKAYTFDGGSTWQSSNSITINENKTLSIQVRDTLGNKSAILKKEIKNIDKTMPSVSLSGSISSGKQTSSNVTLTAAVNPDSTPSGYKYEWYKGESKINGATSSKYSASTSGTYKVKVITGAGNMKESNTYNVNIKRATSNSSQTKPSTPSQSTTTPTSKISVTDVKGNPSNWTSSNVELTVTASASDGLNSSAYSFNGGSSWQSSNKKSFSSNETIKIVVRDTKGKKSDVKEIKITKIDKTKPSVTISNNAPVEGATLVASVNPSSTSSGYKYQWYKGETLISGATSSKYVANSPDKYSVKVTTGANLSSNASVVVSASITPVAKISANVTSGTWTNADVILSASLSNSNGSISKYVWYNGNKAVATTTTPSYKLSISNGSAHTGTYKVQVVMSNSKSYLSGAYSANIDKVAPTCSISNNLSSTATSSTLKITGSDSNSGLQSLPYSFNKSLWGLTNLTSKKVSSNGTYTGYARDKAGNIGTCSINVNNIKAAATCSSFTVTSGTVGTNGWYKGDSVTLTAKLSDGTTGTLTVNNNTNGTVSKTLTSKSGTNVTCSTALKFDKVAYTPVFVSSTCPNMKCKVGIDGTVKSYNYNTIATDLGDKNTKAIYCECSIKGQTTMSGYYNVNKFGDFSGKASDSMQYKTFRKYVGGSSFCADPTDTPYVNVSGFTTNMWPTNDLPCRLVVYSFADKAGNQSKSVYVYFH